MTPVKIEKKVDKELLKKYRRLHEDFLWILNNKEELRSTHANKYIAVENKKVLFSDDTMNGIMAKIIEAGQQVDDFIIEYIEKNPTHYLFAICCPCQ